MQPPAGRKEDSKLTRTLVLGALVAALLSKGTKARMKEEAKEERLGVEVGRALSLKAFVRPSKRHTIRRLRSRTWPG